MATSAGDGVASFAGRPQLPGADLMGCQTARGEIGRLAPSCEALGMNMSTALNVFLRQCVINRGIPFQVCLDAQRDREPADDDD